MFNTCLDKVRSPILKFDFQPMSPNMCDALSLNPQYDFLPSSNQASVGASPLCKNNSVELSAKKFKWWDEMLLKQQQRKHQEKLQQLTTQKEDSKKRSLPSKNARKISQVRNQDIRTGQAGLKYHPTGAWASQKLADKEISQPPGWASSPWDSSTWRPDYPNPASAVHPMGSDPTPNMARSADFFFPLYK